MSRNHANPTNWDDYQYGTSSSHRGSVSSTGGRSVSFADSTRDHSPSDRGDEYRRESQDETDGPNLRRRRSSINMRLNALGDIGGVNSINNFARSWQRAAAFHEVTPQRPSFVLHTGNEGEWDPENQFSRSQIDRQEAPISSLIRTQLSRTNTEQTVVPDADEGSSLITPRPLDSQDAQKHQLGADMHSIQGSVRGRDSIFAIAPHLATPLAGSYGTSYGTLRSTVNESSMIHAGRLWQQQQDVGATVPDADREPLLVKEVEQDGKVVLVVEGQSTLPQTVFNSINVLIGVGILALPLAMKYAGWLCGTIFLAAAALVTAYTSRILAKCLDVDQSMITYADIAYVSFGQRARIATSILFSLELVGACVALIVLFADTLDLLFPSVGLMEWKIFCGLLMIPLNFAPLRILSFTSVLGIISCASIVLIVFIDGFVKPEAPGSLRDPGQTYMFPANWLTLPLSLGLFMSPFAAHSVCPSIYRDMRHPHRYPQAVKITFSFTWLLDALTAVAGYLMFGEGVLDTVTSNIINTVEYPAGLTVFLCVFITIIALTKLPLNARPIVATVDTLSGLDARGLPESSAAVGCSGFARGISKIAIRILLVVILVVTAILFPAFDSIMAFMGSALCFTISIVLPCMFHLKIFGDRIAPAERMLNYFLIVLCSIMAIVGTVWSFLPKALIGAD